MVQEGLEDQWFEWFGWKLWIRLDNQWAITRVFAWYHYWLSINICNNTFTWSPAEFSLLRASYKDLRSFFSTMGSQNDKPDKHVKIGVVYGLKKQEPLLQRRWQISMSYIRKTVSPEFYSTLEIIHTDLIHFSKKEGI